MGRCQLLGTRSLTATSQCLGSEVQLVMPATSLDRSLTQPPAEDLGVASRPQVLFTHGQSPPLFTGPHEFLGNAVPAMVWCCLVHVGQLRPELAFIIIMGLSRRTVMSSTSPLYPASAFELILKGTEVLAYLWSALSSRKFSQC